MCRQYIISGEISLAAQPVLEKHAPTIWRSLSMNLWVDDVMNGPVGERPLLKKNKLVDAASLPAPVAAAGAKRTSDGGRKVTRTYREVVDLEQVRSSAHCSNMRERASPLRAALPSLSLTSATTRPPLSSLIARALDSARAVAAGRRRTPRGGRRG